MAQRILQASITLRGVLFLHILKKRIIVMKKGELEQ